MPTFLENLNCSRPYAALLAPNSRCLVLGIAKACLRAPVGSSFERLALQPMQPMRVVARVQDCGARAM